MNMPGEDKHSSPRVADTSAMAIIEGVGEKILE
jgi:hypothetical protein